MAILVVEASNYRETEMCKFSVKSGIVLLITSLLIWTKPVYSQTTKVSARGLIRAFHRAEISTELNAKIKKINMREGDRFKKGDELIVFDCERYNAELKVAKAGANAAWIDYKTKKRLLAHNAIGKNEVQLSAAQASKASAQAEVYKIINKDCQIKAPFNGRVVTSNVHAHEFPIKDKPLLVILDDSDLEIEMIIPSNWLTWVKGGERFNFKIDETGLVIEGVLDRIGAEIDPVSQTIKAFGVLTDSRQKNILAGMSGSVFFVRGS